MGQVAPTISGSIGGLATSKSMPIVCGVVSHQRAPNDPGTRSFKFTVTDALSTEITGYEWRIYEDDPTPGVLGTVELAGEESAVLDNQEYKYYTASSLTVILQILHPNYEEYTVKLILTGEPVDMLAILIPEEDF